MPAWSGADQPTPGSGGIDSGLQQRLLIGANPAAQLVRRDLNEGSAWNHPDERLYASFERVDAHTERGGSLLTGVQETFDGGDRALHSAARGHHTLQDGLRSDEFGTSGASTASSLTIDALNNYWSATYTNCVTSAILYG